MTRRIPIVVAFAREHCDVPLVTDLVGVGTAALAFADVVDPGADAGDADA